MMNGLRATYISGKLPLKLVRNCRGRRPRRPEAEVEKNTRDRYLDLSYHPNQGTCPLNFYKSFSDKVLPVGLKNHGQSLMILPPTSNQYRTCFNIKSKINPKTRRYVKNRDKQYAVNVVSVYNICHRYIFFKN